jgi:hypothetical protein
LHNLCASRFRRIALGNPRKEPARHHRKKLLTTSRKGKANDRDPDRELARYREAAMAALDQLEWCIDYLYRVRKPDLARAIARNRKQILERLR